MHVAIVSSPGDLSAYCEEILKTWGLVAYEVVGPGALPGLDPAQVPVALCPAPAPEAAIDYARRGGTVACFLPEGALATAAGLEREGAKDGPLRLRMTAFCAAGVAGELLPVVGAAATYQAAPDVQALAYLSHPGRFHGESAGIAHRQVGQGSIVAFAFDLPRCVLLLRQGDPDRAEVLPPEDTCARPSHLATDLGPNDSGWIPFADLLARLLVDVVRACLPAPMPLLSHLPGSAPGMLLWSGDEDGAEVAWNDEELDYVAAAGGRMSLYLIPTRTHSTPEDASRYRRCHDLGPHPDLRALDGEPVAARLAEYERQILLFQEMFGVRTRTLRNHCTAWAGYLEPVEVLERLGVRMEGSYFSGGYLRDRQPAPYAGFGAAMPMRFCRPDGRILHVFQQHTHLSDDVMFHATVNYSYKYAPEQFAVLLERAYADIAGRFHTPLAVCIHPSNWVLFSGQQGRELLRQAAERGIPIWSFDQWCAFWERRDGWRFEGVAWNDGQMTFRAVGAEGDDRLRLQLPAAVGGCALAEVWQDGRRVPWERVTRYRERVALVPLPAERAGCDVRAEYR